jgi:tetratricopeptide (TPR) repeat protein
MENRMEIPTPYFNHAITYIPHDDGDLWLDTVAISKFPNLLFPSQGRNAFVVNGRGGVFKKTPFSGNESSEGEMQVLIKISGETLSVEMNLLAKGALGDIYKNALKAMALEQRKTMAQDLLKGMYPASEIENVTFSNFSDPNAAFKMSTRCRIPYAIPSTSQILQLPFSPMASIAFFSTLTKLSPPADRKTDYITGFGFDIKSQWTYDMTESGFASANLPDAEIMDSEFLRFERRFFEQGRTLRGTSNLTLKTSNVPLEKYSAFYQETLKILQNGHKVLSFQKREVDHAALALETSLKDHPDDVSNILGLAKQYLKSGKYAQANALLGRAVALDPKNGESHYLMGIALGHEYKMEEARKEFEAASRLGYLP